MGFCKIHFPGIFYHMVAQLLFFSPTVADFLSHLGVKLTKIHVELAARGTQIKVTQN